MADLSAFSCGTFDTTTWINDSFRERPEEEALESYLASLAMKLHIISQDYTDQLETGMVEAMTTMPRVLSDVSRIEDVLRNIETEMKSLAVQLRTFDLRNVAGVEDLSRLDTLKNNMEQCKATLEEHARWSQVVREARNFLESGGRLSESADRIETMYRSLDILHNLPGHEERKETCETLSCALLAALRPRVRRDILNLDLSPLQEYLYVYQKLGRETELEDEYVRARPEKLNSMWEQFPSLPSAQYISWLSSLFGKILELLGEESNHAGILFGAERSSSVLGSLMEHSLKSLTIPMETILFELSKISALLIIDVYNLVVEFSMNVVSILSGSSGASLFNLLTILVSGFSTYLDTYGAGEGNYLRKQLQHPMNSINFRSQADILGLGDNDINIEMGNMNKTSYSDLADLQVGSKGNLGQDADEFQDPLMCFESYAEKLVIAADAVYSPTQQGILRGSILMGGLKIKPVCRALSLSLSVYTKELAVKVDILRIACGFESEMESLKSYNVNGNRDGVSQGQKEKGEKNSDEDKASTEQAIIVAKSWSKRLEGHDLRGRVLVPAALRALQAAGRLSRRILDLESSSVEILGALSSSLFADTSMDKLLANQSQQTSGGNTGVGGGGGGMLSQIQSNNTTSTSTSNLSVCEVYACVVLQNDPSAASELKSFFASSSSHHASQTVFASISAPLSRLKAASGALLFDLCTAAPEKMVADLRFDDAWSVGSIQFIEKSDGNTDKRLFNTLSSDNFMPLPSITQVGEHLLSLVQELEAFSSSDALPDLLSLAERSQSITILTTLSARGWKYLKMALDFREEDEVELLCKRSVCATAVTAAEIGMFGAQLSKVIEDHVIETNDNNGDTFVDTEDEDAAALSFVNEWLGAIVDSVIGLVVTQIVQIPVLSPHGRAQLLSDIDYVSNVVQAMGLRQHPLIMHIRQMLLKEPSSFACAIDTMPVRTQAAISLQRLDSKLAKALCVGHGLSPLEKINKSPINCPPNQHGQRA